ncbi:MAG: deoxyribose-phosphate aldolase [Arenicella sp.]|jgi:deoxyribose-phosphate aldolase
MPMNKILIQKYISLIDLTSLSSNDNETSIKSLCESIKPEFHPAAICTYFNQLPTVLKEKPSTIKSAVVAGHFPSGQATLEQKVAELVFISISDVDEIDIVINRGQLIAGNTDYTRAEIKSAREIIGDKCLKVILETGDLSAAQIALGSSIAIKEGADFIKTSTGKSSVGATIEAVRIMAQSIKEGRTSTGIKISGGLRTFDEMHEYVSLITDILGKQWIKPSTFRVGASALYNQLIADYKNYD